MPTMTVVYVKYVEGIEEEREVSPASPAVTNLNGTPKEMLVNINCPIGLIVDYVRETAHLEGEIDLCDETSYQLKNVSSIPGWTRGMEILVPGAVYFIIKIDRDVGGRISKVYPIVTAKASKIAADIMAKLQAPTPAARQRSTSQASKVSQDKIQGRNAQEKRRKVSKPASRDT